MVKILLKCADLKPQLVDEINARDAAKWGTLISIFDVKLPKKNQPLF